MSPPVVSDSLASVGISVVGRLSTQKYPRSSSARIACDFPEPESPVNTMKGCPVFFFFGSGGAASRVLDFAGLALTASLRARAPRPLHREPAGPSGAASGRDDRRAPGRRE